MTPQSRPRQIFWVLFGLWTIVVVMIGRRALGDTSGIGIAIQVVGGLWLAAPVLAAFRRDWGFKLALAVAFLVWLPVWAQVARRIYGIVVLGMEAPDGTGSPVLFMYNFMRELLWGFLPLTAMVVCGIVAMRARRHDGA